MKNKRKTVKGGKKVMKKTKGKSRKKVSKPIKGNMRRL